MVEVLIGEFSFESTKALSAFALGSLLFVITFAVNLIALGIVRRYRLRYE